MRGFKCNLWHHHKQLAASPAVKYLLDEMEQFSVESAEFILIKLSCRFSLNPLQRSLYIDINFEEISRITDLNWIVLDADGIAR